MSQAASNTQGWYDTVLRSGPGKSFSLLHFLIFVTAALIKSSGETAKSFVSFWLAAVNGSIIWILTLSGEPVLQPFSPVPYMIRQFCSPHFCGVQEKRLQNSGKEGEGHKCLLISDPAFFSLGEESWLSGRVPGLYTEVPRFIQPRVYLVKSRRW